MTSNKLNDDRADDDDDDSDCNGDDDDGDGVPEHVEKIITSSES